MAARPPGEIGNCFLISHDAFPFRKKSGGDPGISGLQRVDQQGPSSPSFKVRDMLLFKLSVRHPYWPVQVSLVDGETIKVTYYGTGQTSTITNPEHAALLAFNEKVIKVWTKIPNWRLLLRRQGMLWWNILSSMKIFKCGWTISIFFSTNLMVKDFGSIINIKGVKLVPSFC